MENKNLPLLDYPVSITKGVSPKILRISTLRDVLADIPQQDAAFAFQLEQAAINDRTEYDKLKSQLFGFIAGGWTERKAAACTIYVPYIILDIDKIETDLVTAKIFSDICQLPFTLAAFRSPSGRGIRIVVYADNGREQHAAAYAKVTKYYAEKLGIPTDKGRDFEHLDTSAKAFPRFWYYSYQPSEFVFVNENADTFPTNDPPLSTAQAEPAAKQYAAVNTPTELTVEVKLRMVADMLSARGVTLAKRNNYVFCFASSSYENGVIVSDIVDYCRQFEATDFQQEEIYRTIESAVNRTTVKYNDAQIRRYLGMSEPNTPPSVVPQKNGAAKPKNGSQDKNTEGVKIDKFRPIDYVASGQHDPKRNENKFFVMYEYLTGKYDFRYNVIRNDIEISLKGQNLFEVLDENALLCELLMYGLSASDKFLKAFLGNSRYCEHFDYFKTFFEDVLPQWDGGAHIEKMASYVKTTNDAWFGRMFRKALIRSVGCSLGESVNKQCLTLHGGQNAGKTRFFDYLFPRELNPYFKVGLTLNNEKDGQFELAQNFAVLMDDIDSLGNYKVGMLKSLFTQSSVKQRPPFATKAVQMARRVNFWATTNKDDLLVDDTGNVRWVIFEVKSIQHDNGGKNGYVQNVDIYQMWAEAYAAYKSGERGEMDASEIAESEDTNKKYQKMTYEHEMLVKYYEPCESKLEHNFRTSSELKNELESLLGLQNIRVSLNVNWIGSALAKMGVEKVTKRDPRFNNQPTKGYFISKRGNLPFLVEDVKQDEPVELSAAQVAVLEKELPNLPF
jgi:hypothetical protein